MSDFIRNTKDLLRVRSQKPQGYAQGKAVVGNKSKHVSPPGPSSSASAINQVEMTQVSSTVLSRREVSYDLEDQEPGTNENETIDVPSTQKLATQPSSLNQAEAMSPRLATTSSDKSLKTKLWDEAFRRFRESDDQKFLENWKAFLATSSSNPKMTIDLSSRDSVANVVEALLKKREEQQWKIKVFDKDIKIRSQVDKLAGLLVWADPVVKSAASFQPYAALAWSGVSLFVSVLKSGLTQNGEMLEGFIYIGQLQMYWQICEEKYLNEENGKHYESLIDPLAELYCAMMEYQARMISQLSHRSKSRAVHNVIGVNSWSEQLTSIKNQDTFCREHFLPIGERSRLWENSNCQLHLMRQQIDTQQATFQHLKEHLDDKKERKLLVDLYQAAGNYRHSKDLNPKRITGTCEWFLKDDRFLKWHNGTSEVLWVSAGPGRGKSVLARSLVDEGFLDQHSFTVTPSSVSTGVKPVVVYFFFKEGANENMDSARALCAILHQLLQSPLASKSIQFAVQRHEDFGQGLTRNLSQLWEILIQCAMAPGMGEIFCVLDALDECERHNRKEFIDCLREFYISDRTSSAPNLKFIITSRPYQDLEDQFRRLGATSSSEYIRLDGDAKSAKIQREISLVIDARIKEVTHGFDSKDREELANHLKSMENHTYLWLHLIFDVIENDSTRYKRYRDIKDLLRRLPVEVSDAYEEILNRSKDKERTRIILQLVLAARRPLTLEEANYALALTLNQSPTYEELKRDLWPQETFQATITNACGLFISVYDGKLSFIHQTAREFLTDTTPKKGSTQWKGSLTLSVSDAIMSKTCIQYLSLVDIKSRTDTAYIWGIPRICSNKYPFIQYSAIHWPDHFRDQDADAADDSLEDACKLCHIQGSLIHVWHPFTITKYCSCFKYTSDLLIAVDHNLGKICQSLLNTGADANYPSSGLDNPPLFTAARKGHDKIVEILIDNGASIDHSRDDGLTALMVAVKNGHSNVVETLLFHGADVNKLHTNEGRTALSMASYNRHQTIVKILLANGANPAIFKKPGISALHSASIVNSKEIVTLLLDHGADIDEQEWLEETVLHRSLRNENLEIAKLLIRKGANTNIPDSCGRTALHLACLWGFHDIVKLLLEKGPGAKILIQDDVANNSPLDLACHGGYEGIFRSIVGKLKVSDADIQASFYRRATYGAAQQGYLGIIGRFFQKYADANLHNEFFAQTLAIASGEGHQDIVKFLLDKGAHADAHEMDCYAPLQIACKKGRCQVVEMLLGSGASVGSFGIDGFTQLQEACYHGHQAVVELLLMYGADINLSKEGNESALSLASCQGHQQIVEMLRGIGTEDLESR